MGWAIRSTLVQMGTWRHSAAICPVKTKITTYKSENPHGTTGNRREGRGSGSTSTGREPRPTHRLSPFCIKSIAYTCEVGAGSLPVSAHEGTLGNWGKRADCLGYQSANGQIMAFFFTSVSRRKGEQCQAHSCCQREMLAGHTHSVKGGGGGVRRRGGVIR